MNNENNFNQNNEINNLQGGLNNPNNSLNDTGLNIFNQGMASTDQTNNSTTAQPTAPVNNTVVANDTMTSGIENQTIETPVQTNNQMINNGMISNQDTQQVIPNNEVINNQQSDPLPGIPADNTPSTPVTPVVNNTTIDNNIVQPNVQTNVAQPIAQNTETTNNQPINPIPSPVNNGLTPPPAMEPVNNTVNTPVPPVQPTNEISSSNNNPNKGSNKKLIIILIIVGVIAIASVIAAIFIINNNKKTTTINDYENATDDISVDSSETIEYKGFSFTKVPGYQYSSENDGLVITNSSMGFAIDVVNVSFDLVLSQIDAIEQKLTTSGYTLTNRKIDSYQGQKVITYEIVIDGKNFIYFIYASPIDDYTIEGMGLSADNTYDYDIIPEILDITNGMTSSSSSLSPDTEGTIEDIQLKESLVESIVLDEE